MKTIRKVIVGMMKRLRIERSESPRAAAHECERQREVELVVSEQVDGVQAGECDEGPVAERGERLAVSSGGRRVDRVDPDVRAARRPLIHPTHRTAPGAAREQDEQQHPDAREERGARRGGDREAELHEQGAEERADYGADLAGHGEPGEQGDAPGRGGAIRLRDEHAEPGGEERAAEAGEHGARDEEPEPHGVEPERGGEREEP